MIGPGWVQQKVEVVKLIRERMKVAHDRQKSYVDKRRKDLESQATDSVFFRISPFKGVI